MSNIYIQEPPTNGKVLIVTSGGEIDVELWSKECPKACRNFVQLCLEGYYDNSIFHRVVPDFIVQGGDPTGTGNGGESIYGQAFRDEIHSRLRFVRRGLVAMANAGRDDNSSQFFFTLGPTQELQGKHTIFGKVTGNTVYNMLKLAEVEVGQNDRPVDPHKILRTKVLSNPYDDIEPRIFNETKLFQTDSKKKKSTAKATKNFSLLSFGDEAEEDEEETIMATKEEKKGSVGKSSHDLLDDVTLSALPAVDVAALRENEEQQGSRRERCRCSSEEEDTVTLLERRTRKKQRTERSSPYLDDAIDVNNQISTTSESIHSLKKEAKRLKKELLESDKKSDKEMNPEKDDDHEGDNDLMREYKAEKRMYQTKKRNQNSKVGKREQDTLAMLSAFQSKLTSLTQLSSYAQADLEADSQTEDLQDDDISWMTHKLTFEGENKKVMDANVAELDRYEIFDPRNPVTKRRREESKKYLKDQAKKKNSII